MSFVVIIEDSIDIGETLESFARMAGFNSKHFATFDAVTAEDLSMASHIVLDLQMPGCDGIDVLELLSRSEVSVPIILCSGVAPDILDSAVDVLNEYNLNFGGRLAKPFTFKQFSNLLFKPIGEETGAKKPKRAQQEPIKFSRSDLLIALKRDWFVPYFQPQIDTQTNTLFGVECLARLEHPLYGLCSPDMFIHRLIEERLIDQFTEQFVLKALNLLVKINFPATGRVSFNIDPNSLTKQFLSNLTENITAGMTQPKQICFELTELSAIDLSKDVKSMLVKLRMQGFHISLDDFGTGYSTIHELDHLPFNELKIDRAFVSSMQDRAGSLAIVKHTIRLAADMDILVIAEGIEEQSQVTLLQGLGCHYMQGFYYSKPIDIDKLEIYINDVTPAL